MNGSKWSWPRRILLAIVTVLVLLTPIFVWLGLEGHKAHAAFIAFGDELVARNYERAYFLASPDFRANIDETTFEAQQKGLSSRFGVLEKINSSVSEAKVNQDGWSSIIAAHFFFEKGEVTFEVVMKKRADHWELYSYRSL